MKKVLLLIILLTFMAQFGYCQDQPLQLTIKSDKEVYEVGEEIIIKVKFKNSSNDEIAIVKDIFMRAAAAFSVYKKGAKGITSIPLIEIEVPFTSISEEDFQVLSPKGAFEVEENLLGWVGNHILQQGIYEINVMLFDMGHSYREISPKVWSGSFTSNAITIEVVEKEAVKPSCPKCGLTKDVIPIIYGLPGPELMEQEKRGEVELGGCMVYPNAPNWSCKNCEYRW